MMTKKQDRKLLYEMMRKNREKVSFLDKLKRVKFVKSRSMRSEPGKNPFDSEDKQEEEPKVTESDTARPQEEHEPFFKAPVSKRVRRVSRSNTYYKWTAFSVLVGFIIVMVIVKVTRQDGGEEAEMRPDSLIEDSREDGGIDAEDESFEAINRRSEPLYKDTEATQAGRTTGSAAEQAGTGGQAVSSASDEPVQDILTRSVGDHIVVIVQYFKREDLIPVKKYFDNYGIETKIVQRGSNYFLVTANKYLSPYKTGSNSKEVMKRIKEIGGRYEAPAGYEPFAQTPFQDAYWMNVSELQ
jgi:hypothetical protein